MNVNGNSVLSLGAAQTIGSLSGTGNVTGAFVLTVGNANNVSVPSTTYSGVLGFGGVATGLVGTYGTLTINADGSYTYATNAAAQALNVGDSVQDVFSYTLKDSDGSFSTTTVTMTVTGASEGVPSVSIPGNGAGASTLPCSSAYSCPQSVWPIWRRCWIRSVRWAPCSVAMPL